ncbi:MAG TPA: ABC transporter permease, partial [Chloroflexota bacterium]|nr:ABC transporter permease [Chloroflexota bacterium]
MGFRHDLRVVRAVAQKDIQSSLTERSFTVLSIVLPINFLLLFLLFAITGGLAPIAVVMEDRGPYAVQFVSSLENAHSFIVQQTTANEAQKLVSEGRIVAIVTVPASFDTDVREGHVVQLPV